MKESAYKPPVTHEMLQKITHMEINWILAYKY